MRHLIFFFVLALITSCRSQKNLQSDTTISVDSVAQSSIHRTTAVLDSMGTRFNFDFDTLTISVERQVATVPEIVRIKAVKGSLASQKSQHRDAIEEFNRIDTIAYKQSTSEQTTEDSATTRIYDPPNASGLVLLLIIAAIAYFYIHRK